VEDAQHANLSAKVTRVGGDLTECCGAGMKEPRVQEGAVPIGQGQQVMRQGENDVYIWHIEQLPLAGVKPALSGLRLTLRAVPVPTRVV
jgi:hypothetical protein